MINLAKSLGISTLVLGGAMGATALAQTPATDQSAPPATTQSAPSNTSASAQSNSSMNPNDAATYATGKPLENQSNEGFWGHMNPFARKKWVKREVDPIRDRENELDQLQAKNANNIKDVDSRAQAGINNAMMAANTADQHAADAASRANAAQSTATTANSRTDALNGTVSGLDQYQAVTSTDVPFASGRTALGPQGKTTLDDMAAKLAGDKGYIVEIQAYSRSGIQTSQAMADTVARYLVTEHQVPLYRIYRTGLGKAPKPGEAASTTSAAAVPATASTGTTEASEAPPINGVRVTLLHNSLATLSGPESGSNGAALSAIPNQSGQPAPSTNQ
jgi:outer membrane protein OmpA-like peptidoglycan-associated protein